MTGLHTQRLTADDSGLRVAADLLRAGHQVAFPTETVYGLGADARSDSAVAGIYSAKGRPSFNPLIVHVPDLEEAEKFAVFSDQARAVARAFWPGALTLVLPLRPEAGLSKLVTAGLETVALRVPGHPVARALLRAFGGPLAAPSANPSGRISPTSADHVMAGLAGEIAAVVDGGPAGVGVESTILLPQEPPVLLRAGGISREALEATLNQLLVLPDATGTDPDRPTSPGQLLSHYAPKGRVRLEAIEAQEGEVMLGFGTVKGPLMLSERGDTTEAAANLFACLHALDAMGAERIAVAPIPDEGLGLAVNDRLRRAAAPRN